MVATILVLLGGNGIIFSLAGRGKDSPP
jgi:hypothetical protein